MRKILLIAGLIIFELLVVSCIPTPTPTTPTPALTPSPTKTPVVPEKTPLAELTKIKCIISGEVEGLLFHYREESFRGQEDFAKILKNKTKFETEQIKQFKEDLSKYGERNEYAKDFKIEFNEERKSVLLKCDVYNAISKSGKRYSATFFWLLRRLGLDFIDNKFKEIGKTLSWEGLIKGVPTTVTLRFPAHVPAWGQPNGHCHAHVWWEIK